ncbi:PRC-barrel domain containing protein [Pseudotabrizicola alkalilacus]|uniref:PRC-barrel domain containing protein n=2 Tax=Pseudotabrizicola alkalilacus TaxID=2305252 RepID=A0A411Z5K7_9RHOB|nr:PRC-barrel domain containing protein [Pseudotabrizicola alkalilacus]
MTNPLLSSHEQETTMKKLFGTSALVMALAMPTFAQDTTAPAQIMPADGAMATNSPYLAGVNNGVRASDFIGKTIYVTEQDTSTMPVEALAAADASWENAGSISDMIITLDGETQAVLADFGGFLGIGQKTVALSMDDLVMVPDSSSADDYFIVFHGTRAALEGAPEFNPDMVFATEPVDATMAPADGTAPMAPVDGTAPMTPTDGVAGTDPAMTPPADGTVAMDGTMADGTVADDGLVDLATMTEADLIGKRVIGLNDEDVGEISAVAIGADGAIEGAVVDVGGFLGIGERRVALGSETLTIVRNAGGTIDHFRVTMTQDQLETLPEYQG